MVLPCQGEACWWCRRSVSAGTYFRTAASSYPAETSLAYNRLASQGTLKNAWTPRRYWRQTAARTRALPPIYVTNMYCQIAAAGVQIATFGQPLQSSMRRNLPAPASPARHLPSRPRDDTSHPPARELPATSASSQGLGRAGDRAGLRRGDALAARARWPPHRGRGRPKNGRKPQQ
jgi:hypothetical protein